MSLFKKTYQDNLRALKKEQEIKEQKNKKELAESVGLDPFEPYVTDLSDLDVEPVDVDFMFKKNMAHIKNTYQIPMPTDAKFVARTSNLFEGVEALLPSMIQDCKTADSDFLTGYYLAKFHINPAGVLNSFHAGISSDSLIQGMYYAIRKNNPKTKWNMYGCDARKTEKYKSILKNGIRKPCDIYNTNTVTSINIQLSETMPVESIDLYTCDIKSNSVHQLMKQLLLIVEYLSMDASVVLRLPVNWHSYYTSMVTFLLFCIGQFKSVKILKTPWGSIPKYYLILSGFKEQISQQKRIALKTYVAYIESAPVTPLINEDYFDLYDKDMLIQPINQSYINIMGFEMDMSENEVLQHWANLVS